MVFLSRLIDSKEFTSRLFFTALIVFVYRIGSHIAIPGIDLAALNSAFSSSNILGFFNLFSGGGLSRFSLFSLGILPYINASIIMQLLAVAIPRLKEISDEGEAGRKQISQYTRYLSVFLSVIQAVVMTVGFKSFISPGFSHALFISMGVISLVAGSSVVMWLSELATENGLGNGGSLIIFVGIVSQMPLYFQNTVLLVHSGTSVFNVLSLIFFFLLLVCCVVVTHDAVRKVPIRYAKRAGLSSAGSTRSYLPLRIIQGGVMPVIFASAILQVPFFLAGISSWFGDIVAAFYHHDSLIYNIAFCLLIFFFSYFYASITFNPEDIASNLNKQSGFLEGVRPGIETVSYLDGVLSKLTLVGATVLSLISVLPVFGASLTQVSSFSGLGGTAILIIVGVAMDIVKQINTYVVNARYEEGL